LGTHLFAKVPQPGDSEATFSVSSEAVTCCYQSNSSKVEAIPLSDLPKDTISELAGLPSHYPFLYSERQAEKLYIPTFKVIWLD